MSLPYDPQKDEAVAITPLIPAVLKQPGTVGHCAKCAAHVWINEVSGEFAAKNEIAILCPPCAGKF